MMSRSLKPTFRQKVVVKKDEPRDVLLSVACIKDLKEEFNEVSNVLRFKLS